MGLVGAGEKLECWCKDYNKFRPNKGYWELTFSRTKKVQQTMV